MVILSLLNPDEAASMTVVPGLFSSSSTPASALPALGAPT
jgi:hypothetical protein